MIVTIVWNNVQSIGGSLAGNFTTNGGAVQLFFAGSGYSASGPAMLGVQLALDGNIVTTAKVLTNEEQSHKALVPSSLVLKLPAGGHGVKIVPLPSTTVDNNDVFTLTVTEYS